MYQSAKEKLKELIDEKNEIFIYLISNFTFFYFLWFLPKQKSHHYAVPCLTIFVILLLAISRKFNIDFESHSNRFYRVFNYFASALVLLICSLIFFVKGIDLNSFDYFIISLYFGGIVFLLIYDFVKSKNLQIKLLTSFLLIGGMWTIIAPSFYLPVVPDKTKQLVGKSKLNVVYRKPYFIEEAIGNKITVLDPSHIDERFSGTRELLLIREEIYDRFVTSKYSPEVLNKWPVWKRGSKANSIFNALRESDLSSLQENMLLVKLGSN